MSKKNKEIVFKLPKGEFFPSRFHDDSPVYSTKEKFLEKVVFEVRHIPHFEMIEGKSRILRKFIEQYPKTWFYNGISQLEDGIKFSDVEDRWLFWPRCQVFSLEDNGYDHYENFKEKCQSVFRAYNSVFEIPMTTRIGLRYRNKINRKHFPDDPQKCFSIEIKMGGKEPELAFLEIRQIIEPGVWVTTRLEVAKAQDNEIYISRLQ